jgi:hypothetical protein
MADLHRAMMDSIVTFSRFAARLWQRRTNKVEAMRYIIELTEANCEQEVLEADGP